MPPAPQLQQPDAAAPSRSRRRRRGDVVAYDFRRPAKLTRDHVRVLERASETFARQWTTVLSASLRAPVGVTAVGVEQQTYDEWIGALVPPVPLAVLAPDPLPGTAVLQLDLLTAMLYVDHVLGGPGTGPQPVRPLTDIEDVLLRDLAERVLRETRYAFEQVAPLVPRLLDLETNPQFVQAAAATDVVVVLQYEVLIGTTTRPASLLLPLEPLVARLDASRETAAQVAAREAAARLLDRGVSGVPVEVSARLRGPVLDAEALLALKPGDELRLPHPASAPAELVTHDAVVARGVVGARGARLACLITSEEGTA